MLEITFHHVTAEVGQAVNRPVVVLKRTPQVLLRGKGEGVWSRSRGSGRLAAFLEPSPASPAGLEGWGTELTLAGISDSFIITLSILQCTSNLLILFEHLCVFYVTFILA